MTELEVLSMRKSQIGGIHIVSWKVLSLKKVRVNKRVGRSRVHKGLKDCVRDHVRSKREYK